MVHDEDGNSSHQDESNVLERTMRRDNAEEDDDWIMMKMTAMFKKGLFAESISQISLSRNQLAF